MLNQIGRHHTAQYAPSFRHTETLHVNGETAFCARDISVLAQEESVSKYSLDQLKQKLITPGWRTNIGNDGFPVEGTLSEMVEAAHGRRKKGHAMEIIEEIETKIELDLIQLELLWHYMGLPTI